MFSFYMYFLFELKLAERLALQVILNLSTVNPCVFVSLNGNWSYFCYRLTAHFELDLMVDSTGHQHYYYYYLHKQALNLHNSRTKQLQ